MNQLIYLSIYLYIYISIYLSVYLSKVPWRGVAVASDTNHLLHFTLREGDNAALADLTIEKDF